jgi:hypothetical protein
MKVKRVNRAARKITKASQDRSWKIKMPMSLKQSLLSLLNALIHLLARRIPPMIRLQTLNSPSRIIIPPMEAQKTPAAFRFVQTL